MYQKMWNETGEKNWVVSTYAMSVNSRATLVRCIVTGYAIKQCYNARGLELSAAGYVNPLSPNIPIQILQTDLQTFPWRISWENLAKDQIFSLCDHFVNSHRLCSWQSMDIVRRKLFLVTIGTSRVKENVHIFILFQFAHIVIVWGIK